LLLFKWGGGVFEGGWFDVGGATAARAEAARSASNTLLVVLLLAMIARGVAHVAAGVRGLGARGVAGFYGFARTYTYVAYGTAGLGAFCVIFLTADAPARAQNVVFASLSVVVWYLLLWPLALRSFLAPRAPLLSAFSFDADASLDDAPDHGLTWLGWLLFALAVPGLGFVVAGWLAGSGQYEVLRINPLAPLVHGDDRWLPLVVTALELAAGLALIAAHPVQRYIVPAFGAAGALATVFNVDAVLNVLDRGIGDGPRVMTHGVQVIAMLAMSLVVPLGATYFVLREQRRA
jgi:hypothetical protein